MVRIERFGERGFAGGVDDQVGFGQGAGHQVLRYAFDTREGKLRLGALGDGLGFVAEQALVAQPVPAEVVGLQLASVIAAQHTARGACAQACQTRREEAADGAAAHQYDLLSG